VFLLFGNDYDTYLVPDGLTLLFNSKTSSENKNREKIAEKLQIFWKTLKYENSPKIIDVLSFRTNSQKC